LIAIDWIGLDCGMRNWDRLTECINDTCGPNTTTGQCFVCPPPPSMPEPQSTFIAIIMTSPNMCTQERERERLIESNRIDKDVRLKSSSLQPMVDIGPRTTDGLSIPIHATGLEYHAPASLVCIACNWQRTISQVQFDDVDDRDTHSGDSTTNPINIERTNQH